MADQPQQQPQQGDRMKAPFPAPPPFYKHFTTPNLTELRRLRKEAGIPTDRKIPQPDEPPPDLDTLTLPPELRYLIPPPPPPTDSTFHSFGHPRSLSSPTPTLSDLSNIISPLCPTHPSLLLNPQAHLISLARSQLTTFLTLIGNLSQNPEEGWEQETRHLEVLTFNMLDLINRYRPHQARETVILGMEGRVERVRGEIEGIKEGRRKAYEIMGRLMEDAGNGRERSADAGVEGGGKVDGGEVERKARQRAAWAALEDIAREDN